MEEERKIIEKVISFYNENPFVRHDVEQLLNEAGKIKGKHILDAGCGSGRMLFQLLFFGGEVSGIDQSEISINLIRRQLKELDLTCKLYAGDITIFSFPKRYYDYVFCIGVLHHMPAEYAKKALRNLAKSLAHNGTLEVMVYNRFSFENLQRRLISFFLKTGVLRILAPSLFQRLLRGMAKSHLLDAYTHPYWRTYTRSQLKKLCEDSGFCVVEMYSARTVLEGIPYLILPPIISSVLNKFFSRYIGDALYAKCQLR